MAYHATRADWDGFFLMAAKEGLTNIKALSLLSREIQQRNVVVYGSGKPFEASVRENNIDLGLAIPAQNIALAVWIPVNNPKDPEHVLHMKVIYWKSFKHKFRQARRNHPPTLA